MQGRYTSALFKGSGPVRALEMQQMWAYDLQEVKNQWNASILRIFFSLGLIRDKKMSRVFL